MLCQDFQSGICRSCNLLDQSYEETLAFKQQRIAELFPEVDVGSFVPCQPAAGSRIRARLAVTGSCDSPQIGFVDDQRRIVPVDRCPLHHPLITDWVRHLPDIISSARLTPYDMAADQGELKYVVVTCSPSHGRLMIQFVLRSREALDRVRRWWRTAGEAQRNSVDVVSVNLQPVRSSLINGAEEIPLSERTQLQVTFCGTTLLFGTRSFIQTNYRMAEELYRAAGSQLKTRAAHRVLDLYCGAGAFSLTSAPDLASIVGIDSSSDAIECATQSAKNNGLRHVHFHCLPLNQPLPPEVVSEPFDTIICNPPRRGLDTDSLRLIQDMRPRRIMYSSCHPGTLARDASLLSEWYCLSALQPFDMFPYSSHCEVLAVLEAADGHRTAQ